jgi:hypothetical protein
VLLKRLRELTARAGSGFAPVSDAAEPLWPEADATLDEAEAEVVEGGPELGRRAVGEAERSGFTAFLDGIQRARVAAYHGTVPLVYAWGGAVVRGREDRRMAPGALPPIEREALFFPFSRLPPELVRGSFGEGFEFVDTAEGEEPPLFPPLLRARAAQRVNRWREALESEVARRWCVRAGADAWLIVDGGLTLSPELAAFPRAVGVIKSHRTRFFDDDDARLLYSLAAGERSTIFRPLTRRLTPVHSWYLRLRPAMGHDVLWGLVRVEVAANAATPEAADRLSRWLLTESVPPALPDARWDRLLYPIRGCEEFLRSRAPSVMT